MLVAVRMDGLIVERLFTVRGQFYLSRLPFLYLSISSIYLAGGALPILADGGANSNKLFSSESSEEERDSTRILSPPVNRGDGVGWGEGAGAYN